MADDMIADPVCGMRLDSTKAQFTSDYEGARYYFCSENCKHTVSITTLGSTLNRI